MAGLMDKYIKPQQAHEHSFDLESRELVDYVEQVANHIVSGVRERGGKVSPFSANGAKQDDLEAYYHDKLSDPAEAIKVLQRIGPIEFDKVARAVGMKFDPSAQQQSPPTNEPMPPVPVEDPNATQL